GDAESFACTRPLPTSDAIPPLPTSVIFNPQALNEALTGEIRHLKIATAELGGHTIEKNL
ncbi:Hypothetical predicted protein, partial [Olea europaea subsp. europaea]